LGSISGTFHVFARLIPEYDSIEFRVNEYAFISCHGHAVHFCIVVSPCFKYCSASWLPTQASTKILLVLYYRLPHSFCSNHYFGLLTRDLHAIIQGCSIHHDIHERNRGRNLTLYRSHLLRCQIFFRSVGSHSYIPVPVGHG
jgi:hypothetical protein